MRLHHHVTAGLLLGLVLVVAGCSSNGTRVTGNTGMCTETGSAWSGDPVPGGIVPGSVLERDVDCTGRSFTDARLDGDTTIHFRCEFTAQDGGATGHCNGQLTATNEGGTWFDPNASITISVTPGEPSKIVEEGVQVGTGDYEGLQFAYHTESVASGYPWPVSGTIQPVS